MRGSANRRPRAGIWIVHQKKSEHGRLVYERLSDPEKRRVHAIALSDPNKRFDTNRQSLEFLDTANIGKVESHPAWQIAAVGRQVSVGRIVERVAGCAMGRSEQNDQCRDRPSISSRSAPFSASAMGLYKPHEADSRRPTAHQNGARSEKMMSRRPAARSMDSIWDRVKRCSSGVPSRSYAFVRIV